jgi:hypothetical protein
MMLRHPESAVAEALDVMGEIGGVPERLTGIAVFYDRREVKNGEREHKREVVRAGRISIRHPPLWSGGLARVAKHRRFRFVCGANLAKHWVFAGETKESPHA